jgi:hypothetical protein
MHAERLRRPRARLFPQRAACVRHAATTERGQNREDVVPKPSQQTPQERKRLVTIGLVLGAIALFMYGSIILKTALMGP